MSMKQEFHILEGSFEGQVIRQTSSLGTVAWLLVGSGGDFNVTIQLILNWIRVLHQLLDLWHQVLKYKTTMSSFGIEPKRINTVSQICFIFTTKKSTMNCS